MRVIKYDSEDEVQSIIAEQELNGLILVEVANVTEGNFLAFDDRYVEPVMPSSIPRPIEEQLSQIKGDNLILMDALATVFEEVLMLREQLGGTV
ncbi:hypothetical protein [Desulfitobacterium hafniense]|uniref:hypothetical protein n=1 Tax=Desulfitobacterium hafniense TaxID=49338 RepID=UPI0003789873|nr:hypothetical protein [Desulfitobacterium hafniense]